MILLATTLQCGTHSILPQRALDGGPYHVCVSQGGDGSMTPTYFCPGNGPSSWPFKMEEWLYQRMMFEFKQINYVLYLCK